MEVCDCGAPLDFSPDGRHCLACYEAIGERQEVYALRRVDALVGPINQYGETHFERDHCISLAKKYRRDALRSPYNEMARRGLVVYDPERYHYVVIDQLTGVVVFDTRVVWDDWLKVGVLVRYWGCVLSSWYRSSSTISSYRAFIARFGV